MSDKGLGAGNNEYKKQKRKKRKITSIRTKETNY